MSIVRVTMQINFRVFQHLKDLAIYKKRNPYILAREILTFAIEKEYEKWLKRIKN